MKQYKMLKKTLSFGKLIFEKPFFSRNHQGELNAENTNHHRI